jgi:hypothetical protein
MATGGHALHAIQPEVKAVVVPMIKVPKPSHAVWGATRLPIKPPAAEQSAPAKGRSKIPERGYNAAARVKGLPVPSIGTASGTKCAAPTKAAHTAITAGCIIAGNASLFFIGMNVLTNITSYTTLCQWLVYYEKKKPRITRITRMKTNKEIQFFLIRVIRVHSW